ncbi:hypothetical protein OG912_38530 (plasmid) [Streptomyces sp. NBC_00464]|uniref:hypothetical protein n=1 Tax=Streptomyces sp. NBC_00464 TaxID=2975751 RepID=UPI002E18C34F
MEVLKAALTPILYDLVLERWGGYAAVFDADHEAVPVFTVDGKWVGEAASSDVILDLIGAFEKEDGLR